MSRRRVPYRQVLPALDLSVERYTPGAPSDGAWYLLRAGKQLGRFRSLTAAKEAWDAEITASGWQPPTRPVDPDKTLLRERGERWARNRAG
jgi:hypothetical protein